MFSEFITSVQSKLSVLVDKAQHLSTTGNKHRKVLQALLRRICMHGFVPWNALVPLFDALHNQEANEKGSRLIHYLINTLLSCGAAGAWSAESVYQADVRQGTVVGVVPDSAASPIANSSPKLSRFPGRLR